MLRCEIREIVNLRRELRCELRCRSRSLLNDSWPTSTHQAAQQERTKKMSSTNIVVTGASRGLGRALVLRLAEMGHRVFAVARTQEQLDQLVAEATGEVVPIALDVRDAGAIEAAYAEIIEQHGPVATLINNAAVVENIPFAEQSLEMIDNILDINLKGTLYCTRLLLPHMIEQKSGRIINISSVAGTRGISGQASYCASKHGMIGFGDALSQELIPHGILLTTICPGAIDTPLWDPETNPYPGDLKQVIQPAELVELIEFLLRQPTRTLYKRIVMFPTIEWH